MKMNKTKKIVTLTAAMALTLACGAAFMGNTETNALVFDMRGASIRYQESENVKDNGIRFGVYTDATTYANFAADTNAVVGTLILPTDMLDGELTIDNADAINAITNGTDVTAEENVTVSAWAEAEEGYMESIVYLTDIPKASYNRSLTARGYIDWNGDGTDVQYTTESVSIAIADVALSVMDLPETTAAQKTELQSYINNYTVKFTDDYARTTSETVAYGSEFTAPAALENRTGFNFLGWYEKNADGTYADVATDFETVNKTVKSHREFVAKYEETGKTFSKPGITTTEPFRGGGNASRSYADGNYKITNAAWPYATSGIANDGTSYVLYATMQPTTASEVGFVVTAKEGSYIQFIYRTGNKDMFIWGSGTDAGKWYALPFITPVDVFGANDDQPSTMALIYRDGDYYMAIDGVVVAYTNEAWARDGNYGEYYNGKVLKTIIGSGERLTVGLSSLSATTVFTDWGYSTDEAVINQYGITLSDTINTHYLHKNNPALASKKPVRTGYKLVGNADVPGAWLFNGVEIAQNTDYMVEMSVAGGYNANQGIGFVVGTIGEKCVNNMHIQWNGDANGGGATASGYFNVGRYADRAADRWFGGIYNDNWQRGCPTTIARTGNAMTMTLVYKATTGTYYVFIDGQKAIEFTNNTAFSNSEGGIGNVGQLVGVGQEATIKIGVSLLIGELYITDLGYSTNAADIAAFVPNAQA